MPTTFWGGGKFWQLTPSDCWTQLPKLPQKKVVGIQSTTRLQ